MQPVVVKKYEFVDYVFPNRTSAIFAIEKYKKADWEGSDVIKSPDGGIGWLALVNIGGRVKILSPGGCLFDFTKKGKNYESKK